MRSVRQRKKSAQVRALKLGRPVQNRHLHHEPGMGVRIKTQLPQDSQGIREMLQIQRFILFTTRNQ